MKLRHTAAVLDVDAYTALLRQNPLLARGIAEDIADGAELADVRDYIDSEPLLTPGEAALVMRAAAHLIAQRNQEAIP